MLSWQERDSFREQYDAFYVGLLEEILRLIDEVELRHLSAYEAGAAAKIRFCQLMWERVPQCHTRVMAHKERVTTEKAELNRAASDYEERRQRAKCAETALVEKQAVDRQAEYRALCLKEELDRAEETRQSLEQDARERAKRDEQEREAERQAAEEADRLLNVIERKG